MIKTQNKIIYNLLRVHYNQLYNWLVILIYYYVCVCVCIYGFEQKVFFINTTIVHTAYRGQQVISETNHLLRLVTTHTIVRVYQTVKGSNYQIFTGGSIAKSNEYIIQNIFFYQQPSDNVLNILTYYFEMSCGRTQRGFRQGDCEIRLFLNMQCTYILYIYIY